jgi:hypothetical protein
MQIRSHHERRVAAPPAQIAELIADFDRVWPTQIGLPPRRRDDGLYVAGVMLWEEFDRPGAARAFRVVRPAGLQVEHWFDLQPAEGGTVIGHTVEGSAAGESETIWRERIMPGHDETVEAIFDTVEAAVSSGGRRPGLAKALGPHDQAIASQRRPP